MRNLDSFVNFAGKVQYNTLLGMKILRNLDSFVNFAGKVQYNTLLGMKIQEVMKLHRKALGITQKDLADMSEIAISTIKKIESGTGNPSLSTVEKIMDILGIEVKYEIRQTF